MRDLTTGHEGKQIFYFALPMLIGSLFQQFYNITDSIIVGRFIGTEAMAAVSGASPIMLLLTSLITGITLGFSILVSQYYGSKAMDKVKATLDTASIFIFFGSLIITFIGVLFSRSFLRMMQTPEDILIASSNYLTVIFVGTLFSAGYNGISAVLRGLGDSKNPLYFLIIATILNVILDIVFIVYGGMGVEGVALATIIAQGVAFIFSLIYLNKKHPILKLSVKNLNFDRFIFNQGLRLGVPSAIQQVFFSIGNVALQSLVNSFGTATMAAFGAGVKIESLISVPIINLGAAVSTFVAQNIGANKQERIKKGVHFSLIMASCLALVVATLFLTISEPLIALFDTNPEVIRIGAQYLRTIGPGFIMVCTSFMLTSAVKGAGASMFAMISSIISLWLARIPTAYLLSDSLGSQGIWLAIPVGWAVGATITFIYYKRGSWKNIMPHSSSEVVLED